MLPDERHYNRNTLNLLFSLSSILLLLVLGWLFLSDYVRPWKRLQAEFRSLDIAKTRAKYEEELRHLKQEKEYQALVEEVKKTRKEYEANCSGSKGLTKEIEKLRARRDLAEKGYAFAKAVRDAARYRYELALEERSKDLKAVEAGFLKEEGTDCQVVADGYASLSPLRLDTTYHEYMLELMEAFGNSVLMK